jgi:hypothetical protein
LDQVAASPDGRRAPNEALCNLFDRQTQNGQAREKERVPGCLEQRVRGERPEDRQERGGDTPPLLRAHREQAFYHGPASGFVPFELLTGT